MTNDDDKKERTIYLISFIIFQDIYNSFEDFDITQSNQIPVSRLKDIFMALTNREYTDTQIDSYVFNNYGA